MNDERGQENGTNGTGRPNGGRNVSRYVLRERIGSGGMSTVWLAREKDGTDDLAIKVIPIEDLNPEFERRLRREPEIHRRLEHDNIVQLRDWFREGDEFFLVMEYVEGESLSARIRRDGPIPFTQARDLMRGVLRAVAHLHQNDVIHRDIKPGNILIRPNGEAVLTDFGIAKFGWQQGETRTQAGLGTPEYMSPEQVRGSGIDYRTDIWSLGITLYEMLSGKKPFARGEETPAEYAGVISRIMAAELPDPRKFHPGIPDGAIGVIRTATASDPSQRFSSAAEFLGALEVVDPRIVSPYRDDDATVVLPGTAAAVTAADAPSGTTVVPDPVHTPPPIDRTPPPPQQRAGSKGLVITLVLLLVAAAGYVAWNAMNDDEMEGPSGGLTNAEALGIARGLASEFERYSFNGNIGGLTGLYAPAGVDFYRLADVGRREISEDYAGFFNQIARTDRLDVTVENARPITDSSLSSRWRVSYQREKKDGTLLRGTAIVDLTIAWVENAWLITSERMVEITRDDQAGVPPPDTTGLDEIPVDLPDVEEDPVDPPNVDIPSDAGPPNVEQTKDRFVQIIRAIRFGQGDAAWDQFVSSDLKGRMSGFPAAISAGDLIIESMSADGSSVTGTVAKGEGGAAYRVKMSFSNAPDVKVTSISVSEQ